MIREQSRDNSRFDVVLHARDTVQVAALHFASIDHRQAESKDVARVARINDTIVQDTAAREIDIRLLLDERAEDFLSTARKRE